MKILLLEPLIPDVYKYGSFKSAKGYILPLGMLSLYTILKHKDYEVEFIDTQFGDYDETGLKSVLKQRQFDVVGIPVFTNTAEFSFATARLCREILPDSVIIFGNIHAACLPDLTLRECPECDFIVLGEGEYILLDLLAELRKTEPDFSRVAGISYRQNEQIRVNDNYELIKDLDAIPPFRENGFDLQRYVPHPTYYCELPTYSYITQRGCPYRCSYCSSSHIHGNRIRQFSIDRVVDDLEYLKRYHGARGIQFQDSTFTIDRDYTFKLCELMIKRKLNILWSCGTRTDRIDKELLKIMKKAGCWNILFGVESANPESLKKMNKPIPLEKTITAVSDAKKIGLSVAAMFILGMPGEDEKMVQNTIDFACQLRPHMAMFYLPMPFPGTLLLEHCREDGGLREDADWKDYLCVDYDNPVYVNPLIGKEKMQEFYKQAFKQFYMSPLVWWDNLKLIRNKHILKRYLRSARALFSFFQHKYES